MLRAHVRTSGLSLGLLLACVVACEGRSSEQTREVVDEAARTAERGVEQAKRGLGEARHEAREGLANAREGIADARERFEVDEKVAGARRSLAVGLDEAAQGFAELGEAGRARADQLGDKLDQVGRASLEIAPGAIVCTEEPQRVCKIDPDLIDKLAAEPKLLVGEVSLWPKRGATGQGLQLVRARTESLTGMLGLREGDILLSVNGAELSSLDAIRALDEALSGKDEANLVYERDGQRGELTVIQQPR
ncbi:hypothetical protein [Enhygromyxa salina]|uniref:PDZ domain-containing protein n=1 Tax=Enhygromyxa salina TaxID=215803 RepID=A0A2S9YPG0_9BACT|nr:hypothetical protein [Enhygromyxa salina]PRQ06970.1 hypothetical protein ENSA7_33040 [Enhygromyxa salina]